MASKFYTLYGTLQDCLSRRFKTRNLYLYQDQKSKNICWDKAGPQGPSVFLSPVLDSSIPKESGSKCLSSSLNATFWKNSDIPVSWSTIFVELIIHPSDSCLYGFEKMNQSPVHVLGNEDTQDARVSGSSNTEPDITPLNQNPNILLINMVWDYCHSLPHEDWDKTVCPKIF